MSFPRPGGVWESGGIPRRYLEKIAYRTQLKHPKYGLCGEEGSCLLGTHH